MDDVLIVDIETAPMRGVSNYVTAGEPPKNYKNADTIQKWRENALQNAIDKAALDPDLCRIVAIGSKAPDSAVQSTVASSYEDERDMLEQFWRRVTSDTIVVGYNIIGFDMPVLLRRSLYLNLPNVPHYSLNKYRPSSHLHDLMLMLSMDGALKYRSLDWYARRLGLPLPESPISGAEIPALVESDDWDEVRQHVEDDVVLTEHLAMRLGCWPKND
jgi:predicted PolB exonuclease-like 3'-5' exonuclease|tara:strand:- start:361 stop:1008 length:648 start_codon:yes stop_codon:yes gene_type:complete